MCEVIKLPITPDGRDLLRFMLDCNGGPEGLRLENCDFDQPAAEAIREVEQTYSRQQSGDCR